MNKIVTVVMNKLSLPKSRAHDTVQAVVDSITDVLEADGRADVRGIGVLRLKQRKARKARNPKTGDMVVVPPHTAVTFSPSSILRRRFNRALTLPTDAVSSEQPDNNQKVVDEQCQTEPIVGGHGADDGDGQPTAP